MASDRSDPGTRFRLGKKTPVFDSRTLRFGKYVQENLAAPPENIDWGKNVQNWPLYSNDKYADCTCAAAAHLIENWTAACGDQKTLTKAEVLDFYRHFTQPGPENDCNALTVLKFWRSNGLASHKIIAFAALERRNVQEIKKAVALFGGCYVGIALPKFAAEAHDPPAVPWVVPPQGPVKDAAPDPEFGHCVAAVGYDKQDLYAISWARVKKMSWDFYMDYVDESYAILSDDFISRKNTPSGFDLEQLKLDLKTVQATPPK
jgi:hypothetical protein